MSARARKVIEVHTMNKRIFGIKISTVITIVLSLLAAVMFWLFVGYSEAQSTAGLMRLVLPRGF